MAAEHVILAYSFPASADLSAKQFYAMQINTSGQLATADATVRTMGILQDTPSAAGMAGSLCMLGISKAVSDGNAGAIAIMDTLAPDANGKLVKTTSDNDEAVAVALEASTTDGAIIKVFVLPGRRY